MPINVSKNENPLISEIAFWFFVVSLILCLILYLHAFSSNICVDTWWISPSMYPLLTFVKIGVWIKNMYQVKPVPVAISHDVWCSNVVYSNLCMLFVSWYNFKKHIKVFLPISTFETNFRYIIGSLIIIVRPLYTNSRSSFASHYASHFVQGMLLFI